MEPHEVRVDALWKGGRTAPGSTTVGDFSAGDGELVVRGASRVAASKLGDAEGLVTMDKMLRVYRYWLDRLDSLQGQGASSSSSSSRSASRSNAGIMNASSSSSAISG